MYDAQQTENPPTKPIATMRIDVQTEHKTTKRSEYQTTRRKTNPGGTTNKATTTPHRRGKDRRVNVMDAEPKVIECTLGTIAPHETSHAFYVEKRATTGAYAGAPNNNRTTPADTTTHANHITRHHPRIHPHLTQSHRRWSASTK